jgi:hypothetical protein
MKQISFCRGIMHKCILSLVCALAFSGSPAIAEIQSENEYNVSDWSLEGNTQFEAESKIFTDQESQVFSHRSFHKSEGKKEKNKLTFSSAVIISQNFAIPTPPPFNAIVTPFVLLPDDIIIFGDPSNLQGPGQAFPLNPILNVPDIFGNYIIGIKVSAADSTVLQSLTFTLTNTVTFSASNNIVLINGSPIVLTQISGENFAEFTNNFVNFCTKKH